MSFQPSDSPLLSQLDLGQTHRILDVRVSYKIIKLFSEGLYGSPHKAVEELVSNSYDAGASAVHVLMPSAGEAGESLWVIDDGSGMDEKGFEDLWKIAYSPKSDQELQTGQRLPIGQFGIGKLAAYVLAWHLTHVSKRGDSYFFTSMDFHLVEQAHQWRPLDKPIAIELRQVGENEARQLLREVQQRECFRLDLVVRQRRAANVDCGSLDRVQGPGGQAPRRHPELGASDWTSSHG